MVEDLRRKLYNDGHEDQFPLFSLSARYWVTRPSSEFTRAMTLGEMRR
jgi:hypothetical protein